MVIFCSECQSSSVTLTGKTAYWIDADGGWEYHICQCADCASILWLDEKGFTHLLRENPPQLDASRIVMSER